ncbi:MULTISPECIES: hypothetical protein [Myxococcus]|uniref:hypothetical protein n=1 Tax=Myxococcus TaxID=32 RepID=UPI0013D311D5|nr:MULTISPECIES: hypothetical protein [Myxococcus]NVJ24781.1 hypothetical protein [Myxococcus sp. AM011]
MLATPYALPFVFEVSPRNPWGAPQPVDLVLEAVQPLSAKDAERLQDNVFPFWLLASGGALSLGAPGALGPEPAQPTFSKTPQSARFIFDKWALNERASHCLLCLLLAAHSSVPLKRVRLATAGDAPQPVRVDPKLTDPYPRASPKQPFSWNIEDSESDVRELHITFAHPLSTEQQDIVSTELKSFGAALASGAYGVAPVAPEDCGCLPSEDVEISGNEVHWSLEDCRFHPDALEGLIGVCAALHQRVAPILDVTID